MYKLWMQARANIRKTKSVSVTLFIMFLIAGLLLNAGLLVSINYGGFFGSLKEELKPADVYYAVPDTIYKDEAFEIAAKAIVSDLAAGRVVNGGDFYTFDTDVLVIIGQDWIPAGS